MNMSSLSASPTINDVAKKFGYYGHVSYDKNQDQASSMKDVPNPKHLFVIPNYLALIVPFYVIDQIYHLFPHYNFCDDNCHFRLSDQWHMGYISVMYWIISSKARREISSSTRH